MIERVTIVCGPGHLGVCPLCKGPIEKVQQHLNQPLEATCWYGHRFTGPVVVWRIDAPSPIYHTLSEAPAEPSSTPSRGPKRVMDDAEDRAERAWEAEREAERVHRHAPQGEAPVLARRRWHRWVISVRSPSGQVQILEYTITRLGGVFAELRHEGWAAAGPPGFVVRKERLR